MAVYRIMGKRKIPPFGTKTIYKNYKGKNFIKIEGKMIPLSKFKKR